MAYRSVEIANAFLEIAGSGGLTQMQLQKLVFIANGWNLALSDEALVGENPQAWIYGPVYPDLYDHTKFFGKELITRKITPDDDNAAHFFLDKSSNEQPYSANLTSRENQVICAVWNRYGAISGAKLSAITHQPRTPWSETYNGGSGQNAPIQLNLIKQHYDRLAESAQELLDPSIISQSPIDLDIDRAGDLATNEYLIGYLSEQLHAAEVEIARLKGKESIEDVKVRLMPIYADKVFSFVLCYCAVAIFLLMSVYKNLTQFQLNDSIFAIVAGSTAVAVIGLIGMVVSGLFGSSSKLKK